MGVLLADCNRLLTSGFPEQVLSRPAASRLAERAMDAPDILCGGYEIRFQDEAAQVDLQLCIRRGSSDVEVLRAYLEDRVDACATAQSPWTVLRDFVTEWAAPKSRTHQLIEELWLEFDCNPEGPPDLPSVFIGLPQKPTPVPDVMAVLNAALLTLSTAPSAAVRDQLERFCTACSGDQFVSHVGVMLSRPSGGLRVNVKRLTAHTLAGYLDAVGYSGSVPEMVATTRPLFGASDRATLCFNLGDSIDPTLGVELYFKEGHSNVDAWTHALGAVASGSAPAKQSVLGWPAKMTPDDHPDLWPRELFAASMLANPPVASTFEREISHIKLKCAPGGVEAAKGYLWFQHRWEPTAKADRDAFYSQDAIDQWKRVIGADLHYHNGRFEDTTDPDTAMKNTVRAFWPSIPIGARVLDLGCGWGGPARLMTQERDATVTGVTISAAQTEFCRAMGLNVIQADLDKPFPAFGQKFDVAFSLEMISHIKDKPRFLQQIFGLADTLVLSETCAADSYTGPRVTFGGTMELCSVSELKAMVEAAGWRIVRMEDRRQVSLPSNQFWAENLTREFGNERPSGAFGPLHDMVKAALRAPEQWANSFPLIDIVAERPA